MTGAGPAQGHSREVTIKVNGRAITARVDTRTLLVEFIRETAGQTGTHVGVRQEPMRCVRRGVRRRLGEKLHHARGAGRRGARDDH
jgi:hypothetical protein